MVRLAIIGLDATEQEEVARRLRGVRVGASLNDAEAVAWVGSAALDLPVVQSVIASRRPVLLATDAILSQSGLGPMLDAACAQGGRVCVASMERSRPSRRLLLEEARGPRLGAPGLIRGHRWESAAAGTCDPAGLPAPLVRDLDLVLAAADSLPIRVYAVQRSVDDSDQSVIQVHLQFAGGGMALLDYTNSLPTGDGYQSMSVISAHGAVYADDHPNAQLVYGGGAAHAELGGEGRLGLVLLLQAFVDYPPDGAEPARADWHRVRTLADDIRKSILTGGAVEREHSS